jgi:hypothetical protein
MTAFMVRDEMNMPVYLKIKMALIEHRLITRRPLSADLLSMIDQKHGEDRLKN